ncbi:MAG: YfhO family protein [Lachnospiraceae bacterium]|nr:YfhO family protein [Lachnospiraceae bacterium]
MKKIISYMERKIPFYFTAMLVPMLLFGAICVFIEITPFGDHSFLIADMEKQYLDFFSYYQSIFQGKHHFLYTFSKCLGGDMLGLYVYYLNSPLNLLLLFFPKEYLPAGITSLITLHIGLCGLTMSIYLRNHRFSGYVAPNTLYIWLFSTSYAFMGFMMSNCMNVMWHSVIILFPLVILGLEKLVYNQKPGLYILSLAGALFCNYYMAYMVCIFCVLYFIYLLLLIYPSQINDQTISKKTIVSKSYFFIRSSLLSAGHSAIVLLPAFFSLKGSLKDEQVVSAGITHANTSPLHVLSKLFTFSYDADQLMSGMPNLFCGILIVILVIAYFYNQKISIRERILSFGLLSLLMLCFCNAKLDFVWHAFMEPSGYPYRYSFLFTFLCIVIAYRSFLCLQKEGFSFPEMIFTLTTFLLLYYCMMKKHYPYMNEKYEPIDLFVMVVNLMCLIILSSPIKSKIERISYLFSNHTIRNLAIYILLAIQILNLSTNGMYTYMALRNTSYSTVTEYRNSYQPISEVLIHLQEEDSSFYRMENLQPSSLNNSMYYGYPGLTHYSSNEQLSVLRFLQKMGLNYNNLFVNYGQGSTETVDSLLGVKYLLAEKGTINKPYEQLENLSDQILVYQNPNALPIAFLADKNVTDFTMKEENPFILQEKMYRSLVSETLLHQTTEESIPTIRKPLFVEPEWKKKETKNGITYVITPKENGNLYFYASAPEILQDGAVYLGQQLVCDYFNMHSWRIVNLGTYKKGQTCQVTITASEPEKIESVYFASENRSVLQALREKITDSSELHSPFSVERISDAHLCIQTDEKNDSVLATSIPYETNWHIKVDGEKVEPIKLFDTLLGIPLSSGQHTIELLYLPKGLIAGAIISLLTLWGRFFCLGHRLLPRSSPFATAIALCHKRQRKKCT